MIKWGVASTELIAQDTDSAVIRCPPRGRTRSASRNRGSEQATATGIPGQSRTWRPAVARTSTAPRCVPSGTLDKSQSRAAGALRKGQLDRQVQLLDDVIEASGNLKDSYLTYRACSDPRPRCRL
jgi:hypothetical protein